MDKFTFLVLSLVAWPIATVALMYFAHLMADYWGDALFDWLDKKFGLKD